VKKRGERKGGEHTREAVSGKGEKRTEAAGLQDGSDYISRKGVNRMFFL